MIYCIGMHREDISQGYAFVVGTQLYIQSILGGILLHEMNSQAVVCVTDCRTLAISVMPHGVTAEGLVRIIHEIVEPAVNRLRLLCQSSFPDMIVYGKVQN